MVDLYQVEQDLRTQALNNRINWPIADATNSEIPVEVRTHTKTMNERASHFDVAAEVMKIMGRDPHRWRFLMSLPYDRFKEVVDVEMERQQSVKVAAE